MEALRTEWHPRNVSSTCSSSGSTLWAASKNIKPLVDANRHIETIELVHPQSKIQFSTILYRSPSTGAKDQTILFGCPLELQADGKLPPVLEYLLDSFPVNQNCWVISVISVGSSIEIIATNFLRIHSTPGTWLMMLNKHGQVWKKVIGPSFPSMTRKAIASSSVWVFCSYSSLQNA